jgi:hypothetical protein
VVAGQPGALRRAPRVALRATDSVAVAGITAIVAPGCSTTLSRHGGAVSPAGGVAITPHTSATIHRRRTVPLRLR